MKKPGEHYSLHELFERQVAQTPNNVAAEYECETITYIDLDKRSNKLAHFLVENGVKPDIYIGVFMDRSIEMIVTILGILKAGGGYAPIDPEYPRERIAFLVEDLGSPIILTQSHLRRALPKEAKTKILCVDTEWDKKISSLSDEQLKSSINPENFSYMIFTSGSTGKPKGCQNTHGGIVNYLLETKKIFPLTPNDKMLFQFPYTFDMSVPEIFLPLISGARIVIAKPGGQRDSKYLVDLIIEKNITESLFVPSMLQVLLEEEEITKCLSLRRITVGGEKLPIEVVKKFYQCLPKAKLVSIYGPAEVSHACTYWETNPKDVYSSVPIGHVIPNNKFYVLDESRKPVPTGVFGELYIGGVQVSRGYFNREDLTLERFLKDPFLKDPQAKMYKTGDLVRRLDNGVYEIQGRVDFQVKIRGFRVEPGEIDTVLAQHEEVGKVAVVAKHLHGKENPLSLVAYIVPEKGTHLNSDELREYLKTKVPEYMVPSVFVALDSMPVNFNGKTDRKALMEREDLLERNESQKYVAPKSENEKILARAWEEALQISPIGLEDNYFSLGGDSLSIIRIQHTLHKLGLDLKHEDFYANQTISKLATRVQVRKIDKPVAAHSAPSSEKRFALSRIQEENLSFLPHFNNLFLVNSLSGPLNVGALKESLKEIINRHWVLKSKFLEDENKHYQIVSPLEKEFFFEKDLRDLKETELEGEVTKLVLEACNRPIDLKKGPVIRCDVFRVADQEYYLTIVIHHIAADVVSFRFLRDELKELYAAKISGRQPTLPDLHYQYIDFAKWESQTSLSPHIDKKRDYWRKTLKGLQIMKFPQEPTESKGTAIAHGTLEKDVFEELQTFNRRHNVTLYLTFLYAFGTFIQRLTCQSETVIKMIVSQRPPEFEKLIGLFVNDVPIRITHSPKTLPVELLRQVKENCINCFANQRHHSEIESFLQNEKDKIAFRSIGSAINFHTDDNDSLELLGITCDSVDVEPYLDRLDGIYLNVSVSTTTGQIKYSLTSNLNNVSESTLQKYAIEFEAILREVIKQT